MVGAGRRRPGPRGQWGEVGRLARYAIHVVHDLKTSLRVKVRGFAFFDAWHASAKEPKRGHSHGTRHVATLWEIHPVWRIVPNP